MNKNDFWICFYLSIPFWYSIVVGFVSGLLHGFYLFVIFGWVYLAIYLIYKFDSRKEVSKNE